MRRRNYLNGILTVNAVLLTGLLWVQVAGQPLLANSATAQVRTKPRGQTPIIMPNASGQRQRMIDELKTLSKSVEALNQQIESGTIKVEVTNLDAIGR